jgi:hypothetical protein
MVPSKQKIISSKFLDEEILSQVTLEPEAAIKKYGSEGKMGPWKLPLEKTKENPEKNQMKLKT